jgi:hypothetical protein
MIIMLIQLTGMDDWPINTPFAIIAGILAISFEQTCVSRGHG